MTIRESIETIKAQTRLTREEARAVMQQLLSGSVPDEDIVTFPRPYARRASRPMNWRGLQRSCAPTPLKPCVRPA